LVYSLAILHYRSVHRGTGPHQGAISMGFLDKRTISKRTMMVAIVAVVGLGLSACGGSSSSSSSAAGTASSGGEILIGVNAPLSGDYAAAGTDIVNGALLSAKAINAAGGVDGKMIKIISQDDACSAQVGAQAAQKLISQKVVAVAGGYCSGASLPALAEFHRAG
jgi:branched-chain amino acid transport system substrate-binding protein